MLAQQHQKYHRGLETTDRQIPMIRGLSEQKRTENRSNPRLSTKKKGVAGKNLPQVVRADRGGGFQIFLEFFSCSRDSLAGLESSKIMSANVAIDAAGMI